MTTPDWNFKQVILKVYDSVKNALRVTVVDPIQVVLTDVAGDAESVEGFEVDSNPNTEELIASKTVGAGDTEALVRLECCSSFFGTWTVYINGSARGKAMTGPGHYNAFLEFNPTDAENQAVTGDVIDITFNQSGGPVDKVNASLQTTIT